VVLDEDEDAVLARGFYQCQVIPQSLGGGLGDQDVVSALNGIQSNWVVCRVWGEDCDGRALGQDVNCRLVGVGVGLVVGRERGEGSVEAIVNLGDVAVQVIA
jgi:hypothetical protein